LGEDWCYVYLLLEFQSQPDPWMALRLLVYVGLLYQELVKGDALTGDGHLPPVLPLVLYNGSRPWAGAEEISELVKKSIFPRKICKSRSWRRNRKRRRFTCTPRSVGTDLLPAGRLPALLASPVQYGSLLAFNAVRPWHSLVVRPPANARRSLASCYEQGHTIRGRSSLSDGSALGIAVTLGFWQWR